MIDDTTGKFPYSLSKEEWEARWRAMNETVVALTEKHSGNKMHVTLILMLAKAAFGDESVSPERFKQDLEEIF